MTPTTTTLLDQQQGDGGVLIPTRTTFTLINGMEQTLMKDPLRKWEVLESHAKYLLASPRNILTFTIPEGTDPERVRKSQHRAYKTVFKHILRNEGTLSSYIDRDGVLILQYEPNKWSNEQKRLAAGQGVAG